jgi:hypothetical protein
MLFYREVLEMTKRNIAILLSGLAALSIAGCNPDATDEAGESEGKALDALLDVQNIDPADIAYGDRTTKAGPANYIAEFDALVYFGLDASGQFVSTIRYFTAAGNTYDAIKAQMLACVAILDADMSKDCDKQLKKVTLDDLTFRAPTNVVFVSRNASLKFGTEPLVFSKSLDRDHNDYPDGKKAKPNKSFYNAVVAEEAGRQLVYVRNYYIKGNGQPITKGEKYWYGLNIFMTIDQLGGNPVKIIIDPDGGNMGGNP